MTEGTHVLFIEHCQTGRHLDLNADDVKCLKWTIHKQPGEMTNCFLPLSKKKKGKKEVAWG